MKKVFLLPYALISLVSPVFAQDRLMGKAFATRSVAMAQHGMACTSHSLSTQAAIDVLRSGGNAIEAVAPLTILNKARLDNIMICRNR